MRQNRNRINTNLASEFFVASQLFRQGYDVTITLGHTKEVDLLFENKKGNLISVDVKGLKNMTNYPINLKKEKLNHFFIFVNYRNKIENIGQFPVCFIVPATEIKTIWSSWAGKPEIKCVSYHTLRDNSKYKEQWKLLEV